MKYTFLVTIINQNFFVQFRWSKKGFRYSTECYCLIEGFYVETKKNRNCQSHGRRYENKNTVSQQGYAGRESRHAEISSDYCVSLIFRLGVTQPRSRMEYSARLLQVISNWPFHRFSSNKLNNKISYTKYCA